MEKQDIEFYLATPNRIPAEWRGRVRIFRDTLIKNQEGYEYARGLEVSETGEARAVWYWLNADDFFTGAGPVEVEGPKSRMTLADFM